MNNAERAATNERLYSARLQADWYQQQVEAGDIAIRVLELACGEGLKQQLLSAYRCYLLELSTTYRGDQHTHLSAESLSLTGLHCAELNELLVLERSESWLSELLSNTGNPPNNPTPQTSNAGDIQVFNVAPTQSPISLDRLKYCYLALKKLIDSQRSHSEEW